MTVRGAPHGVRLVPVDGWEARARAALAPSVTFTDVADVAVGGGDRVYLVTRNGAHVLVYSPDAELLDVWADVPETKRLHGITIAPNGDVFLVDDGRHTVRRFDGSGHLLLTMGVADRPADTGIDDSLPSTTDRLRSIRRGGSPFNRPTRLARAPSGEMFVADGYGNARVHRFAPDGRLTRSWGGPGTRPGQFNLPHGIALTEDERVLVADRENDRIQVFTFDGRFLAEWTDLQRPMEVVVAPSGLVFVAEGYKALGHFSFVNGRCTRFSPGRISVLDAGGEVLARLAAPADPDGTGGLRVPHGMAVDSQGCLYVAEVTPRAERDAPATTPRTAGTRRIHKFRCPAAVR